MNFSEAMFYDTGFPYKHYYFKTCLPTRQNGVENRDEAYVKFRNVDTARASVLTRPGYILIHF